ncbi:AAT family amino acid transporter [Scopulibacillus darangshiensis]|uniref:AAT family amino acid transporter n=1 Tax=Scopulibacillus darangshiensis TaxID=442528 RepID=A0A4R2PBP6_9BACL|nr:amino acid permease [Scopulibacillus darangshiensis]TCP31551.1 AAT family amino acid transporter [Scopulibacillus darangshiensis]
MKNGQEPHSEGLSRSLKNRHIQFLALGGVIGVGLFYGASQAVKVAGPAVIIAYILAGVVVAIVMRALGEMTVEKPVAGSFSRYAGDLLGPRMGFLTGGMWWFFWVATVMSELAAIGKLIQFWFPGFPAWIPGLIALVLFTVSNLLVVKIFGELEFVFAILKVLAILAFMVFGALIILTGIFSDGKVVGLTNLWANEGGFLPYGWMGIVMAVSLVIQAYSGIETLAVEAGESDNPISSMPKAFRSVTYRISFFYVGSILIMLCAYPWTNLAHETGSPYVLLFTQIGVPAAATIINILIIFSGLSSCNTGVYGGSRILFSMANDKMMPAGITKLNKNKVPYISIFSTSIAISIGTIITYFSPDYVYIWITSASAFASIFTWIVIIVLELIFRQKISKQNQTLHYPMPLWPGLPILGLIMLVLALGCILYSPLTRLSVLSGVIWLLILIIYYQLAIAPKNRESIKEQDIKFEK